MIKVTYLILLFFFSNSFSSKIQISDRKYIDSSGRVRIFHGVNIVVKIPPYLPSTEKFDPYFSLVEEDFINMKKLGFNIVRLGIFWQAFELTEGVYDLKYVESIVDLVNRFGKHGIQVIVDSHQDIFSRVLCGEGVPVFIVDKLKYSKECNETWFEYLLYLIGVCKPFSDFHVKVGKDGLPLISECKKRSFTSFYQTPDLTSLYVSLYKNKQGIADKYIYFLSQFVSKLKGNPNVFGYDIWNEPYPGNLWNGIEYLIPGNSDNYQILPFYKKINEKIRKIDDDFVFMFEPAPFPDFVPYIGLLLGGFDSTPSGKNYLNKQILNLHDYCCQLTPTMCESGEPPLESAKTVCRTAHFDKLAKIHEQSKNLKVPFIITEFGACSNTLACFYEITGFADAADKYFTSWTYWQYKPYGDYTTTSGDSEGIYNEDGTLQEYKVKGLSRTYVQAYQGNPISMDFNTESFIFETEYSLNSTILAPTEVYFNSEFFYKNGFRLRIFDKKELEKVYNIDVNKTFDVNIISVQFSNKNQSQIIDEDVKVKLVVAPFPQFSFESVDSPNLEKLILVKFHENNFSDKNFLKISDLSHKISDIKIEQLKKCDDHNFVCERGVLCDIGKEIIDELFVSFKYNNSQVVIKLNNLVSDFITIEIN